MIIKCRLFRTERMLFGSVYTHSGMVHIKKTIVLLVHDSKINVLLPVLGAAANLQCESVSTVTSVCMSICLSVSVSMSVRMEQLGFR
jgi:hypothetical protein